LTLLKNGLENCPDAFKPLINGAKLYDSSCSAEARVVFIDKDGGYFLKSAPRGALAREAALMRFFFGKGLAANVLGYVSEEQDWLLTEKIRGDDCTAAKYLEQPERLCDICAERLAALHETDHTGCPVDNHTELYLAKAALNKKNGSYDTSHFPDSWGYKNEGDAWGALLRYGPLLKTDTLLHGDYCLPNIILNDWRFGGFIDLGNGGIGDRHVDIFWGIWTLGFNLKTDRYRGRFMDAYGRENIDDCLLRAVAAAEVFG